MSQPQTTETIPEWETEYEKSKPADFIYKLPSGRNARIMKHKEFQTWMGYIGVDISSPLYKKSYEKINGCSQIHGGLTFSGFLPPLSKDDSSKEKTVSKDIWWFGMDCSHGLMPLINALNADKPIQMGIHSLIDFIKFFREKITDIIPAEEKKYKRMSEMCKYMGIKRSYKTWDFVKDQLQQLDAIIEKNEENAIRALKVASIARDTLFSEQRFLYQQLSYHSVRVSQTQEGTGVSILNFSEEISLTFK